MRDEITAAHDAGNFCKSTTSENRGERQHKLFRSRLTPQRPADCVFPAGVFCQAGLIVHLRCVWCTLDDGKDRWIIYTERKPRHISRADTGQLFRIRNMDGGAADITLELHEIGIFGCATVCQYFTHGNPDVLLDGAEYV